MDNKEREIYLDPNIEYIGIYRLPIITRIEAEEAI
jgi:hypothetical protein